MKKKDRKANIDIEVSLNENNIPELISWKASDQKKNQDNAEAFLLSFWDSNTKNSFNIDLWTKEMTVQEMKFFIFQNLLKMSSILERSTGDKDLVKKMKDFSREFGEMADIIKR
jgi:gliding motility-associated protein GldC|tara:strand:- start:23 stop:364 length:342 start_codon:yes stop_codon:yes gene_type:complete